MLEVYFVELIHQNQQVTILAEQTILCQLVDLLKVLAEYELNHFENG
jgi:hypothetical protein